MKKVLIFLFLILVTSSVLALGGVSYSMNLKYDGDKVSLNSLDIIDGNSYKNINYVNDDYFLRIFDSSNELKYEDRFSMNLLIFSALRESDFDIDGNRVVFQNESSISDSVYVSVSFPYEEDYSVAKIYSSNEKLLLTVDLNEKLGVNSSWFNELFDKFNLNSFIVIILILLTIAGIPISLYYDKKRNENSKTKSRKKSSSKSKKTKIIKKNKNSLFSKIFNFNSKPKKKTKKSNKKYCGKCGKALHKSDRFCKKCGRKA